MGSKAQARPQICIQIHLGMPWQRGGTPSGPGVAPGCAC